MMILKMMNNINQKKLKKLYKNWLMDINKKLVSYKNKWKN